MNIARKHGQSYEAYKKELKLLYSGIKRYLSGSIIFSGGTFSAGMRAKKSAAWDRKMERRRNFRSQKTANKVTL